MWTCPEIVEMLVEMGDPIVAEITNAEISSPAVVEFSLATSRGTPLIGLPPESISFTLIKLLPAANGLPVRWQSYINTLEEARDGTPSPNLLEVALQSDRDSGGELVDNRDGTYEYTFATDVTNITDPVEVSYEPSLTHRVGFEIRLEDADAINPDNPTLDFVPDGTAGSGTKDIAATASCNSCHETPAPRASRIVAARPGVRMRSTASLASAVTSCVKRQCAVMCPA